jgi:hypothetical protein
MKSKKIIKFLFIILAFGIITVFSNNAKASITPNNVSVDKVRTEFATKVPIGKRELAMKFLLAMLGVATSSVVIYVGLSMYNKFVYSGNKVVINEDDNEFKTPTNMKEAINIFLKKTK